MSVLRFRIAWVLAVASAGGLPLAACGQTLPEATDAAPADAPGTDVVAQDSLGTGAPGIDATLADVPVADSPVTDRVPTADSASDVISAMDVLSTDSPELEGSCGADGGSACTKCVFQFCCSQVGACRSDPDCAAYITCSGDCKEGGVAVPDGSPCLAACSVAHPSGRAEVDAIVACQNANCSSEGC